MSDSSVTNTSPEDKGDALDALVIPASMALKVFVDLGELCVEQQDAAGNPPERIYLSTAQFKAVAAYFRAHKSEID